MDLTTGYMTRSVQGPVVGKDHTSGYWMWWRECDTCSGQGWRTLFRGQADHFVLVYSGKTDLGFYSNRNGNWRDSGYDLTGHKSGWQLVVAVGQGCTGCNVRGGGKTTFFIGGDGHALKKVGEVDRVASGVKMYRLGWPGQGPGWIAEAHLWNRALTLSEMSSWWAVSICAAGKFASSKVTKATDCKDCAAGTYSVAKSVMCAACELGKYQSAAGATACTACATGTVTAKVGASTSNLCVACPAGQTPVAAMCTPCPAGKFASSAKSTTCTACAAGLVTRTAGSVKCEDPIGIKSPNGDFVVVPKNPTLVLDAAATDALTDSAGGTWTITSGKLDTLQTFPVYNLDRGYMSRKGAYVTAAKEHTTAYWVWWRACDSCGGQGWRTLFRGNADHFVLVYSGRTDLGFYSNRNGGWRDSGYNLVGHLNGWHLIVAVGKGNTDAGSDGTTTFWVGEKGKAVKKVGTVNRVASGVSMFRLGWPGQGPGKVASAYLWQRALADSEIARFYKSATACAAGKFSTTVGATAAQCKTCALGRYAPAKSPACAVCARNTYGDATGASTCKACAKGKVSDPETTSVSGCSLCPVGKYTGVGGCTLCQMGKYNGGAGAAACTVCAKGTFAEALGSTVCGARATSKSPNGDSILRPLYPTMSLTARAGLTDSAGGSWTYRGGKAGTYKSVQTMDLNAGYMDRSGGGITVSKAHSFGYWLWWRPCNACNGQGWRTLFRGNSDHTALVFSGKTDLGFYSNRNGNFRDTGYDLTGHLTGWQLVITVGVGDTETSNTGTTTFYVGGGGHSMKKVGVADRVASGTNMYRLGWPGQGPGHIVEAHYWNRALTLKEVTDWWLAPSLCTAGTYGASTSTSQSQCVNCRAGTYCPAQSTKAAKCAAGKYQDAAAGVSCKTCAAGTGNTVQGSTSSSACGKCAAGKAATAGLCAACGLGKYSDSVGSTTCTACSGSLVAEKPGSTTCTRRVQRLSPRGNQIWLPKYPDLSLDASSSVPMKDTRGVTWTFVGGKLATKGNKQLGQNKRTAVKCFDLNRGYMNMGSGNLMVAKQHTSGYWLWWRGCDSCSSQGWRTLFRGNSDHFVLVSSGRTDIGFYSNRNGGWRDSGYNLAGHKDGWQLVVAVGKGDNADASTGTTQFYVGGGGHEMKSVGSVDRVASGVSMYRLGWPGQGPGYIAEAHLWNRALTYSEILAWWGKKIIPPPTNCVGEWSKWSTCSKTCGGGMQTSDYAIITKAMNGGKKCTITNGDFRSQKCSQNACAPPPPPPKACTKAPCKNAALCVNGATFSQYTCQCRPGWKGQTCGTDMDDCVAGDSGPAPCKNGATCQDAGVKSYRCTCKTGWTGTTCDQDIDDCVNEYGLSPCKNDGKCTDLGANYYKCRCLPGWKGQTCEYEDMQAKMEAQQKAAADAASADAGSGNTLVIVVVVAAAAVAIIAVQSMGKNKRRRVGTSGGADAEFESEKDYEFEMEDDDYEERPSGDVRDR